MILCHIMIVGNGVPRHPRLHVCDTNSTALSVLEPVARVRFGLSLENALGLKLELLRSVKPVGAAKEAAPKEMAMREAAAVAAEKQRAARLIPTWRRWWR